MFAMFIMILLFDGDYMYKSIRVLGLHYVLLFACTSVSNNTTEVPSTKVTTEKPKVDYRDFVITKDAVGPLKLGEKKSVIKDKMSSYSSKAVEQGIVFGCGYGPAERIMYLNSKKEPILILEFEDPDFPGSNHTLLSIIVMHPDIKTKEGINNGMTVKDLVRAQQGWKVEFDEVDGGSWLLNKQHNLCLPMDDDICLSQKENSSQNDLSVPTCEIDRNSTVKVERIVLRK